MILTAAERAVVADLCPFPIRGVAEDELEAILDAWFAHDHYDENPAYTWKDDESNDDAAK